MTSRRANIIRKDVSMQPKTQRSSNLELLRILSMLMIIVFHCVLKSEFKYGEPHYNKQLTECLTMLGEIGVDCFILITGYFMVGSRFKWRKFVLLNLELVFYCWLSYGVQRLVQPEPINGRIVLEMIFPMIYNRYWFATAYLLLYLLCPFINRFVKALDQRELQRALGLFLALWCVIPTLFGAIYDETEGMMYYNRLIWLIVVYMIGAYLRLYPRRWITGPRKAWLLALGSFATLCLSVVVINLFPTFFGYIGIHYAGYLWRPNTVPVLACSIGLFLGFSQLRVRDSRLVNAIASTTFGVYMLHDGVLLDWLWNTVVRARSLERSPWLVGYIVGVSVVIFAVGCVVDLARQQLERRIALPLLDRKR